MSRSGFGTMNAAENLSDRLGTCATEKSLMKPCSPAPGIPLLSLRSLVSSQGHHQELSSSHKRCEAVRRVTWPALGTQACRVRLGRHTLVVRAPDQEVGPNGLPPYRTAKV